MFPQDRQGQPPSIEPSSPDSSNRNGRASFSQYVNLVPAAWDFEGLLQLWRIIRKQLVESFLTETRRLASFGCASQPLRQIGNSRDRATGKIANGFGNDDSIVRGGKHALNQRGRVRQKKIKRALNNDVVGA